MADKNGNSAANLGFEDKLWKAADALRSNMDAAEYKHVVLGLIFLNPPRAEIAYIRPGLKAVPGRKPPDRHAGGRCHAGDRS